MNEDMETIRGSGNVFADLGEADAAARKMKSVIAAEIIAVLNRQGLTVRAGAKLANADAADIQRIRSADLSRFTIDRLVRIACRLGCSIELKIVSEPAGVAA